MIEKILDVWKELRLAIRMLANTSDDIEVSWKATLWEICDGL